MSAKVFCHRCPAERYSSRINQENAHTVNKANVLNERVKL
jgi:hypothetical protein